MTKVRGKNNLGISFYFSPHSFIVIEKKKPKTTTKQKNQQKKKQERFQPKEAKYYKF